MLVIPEGARGGAGNGLPALATGGFLRDGEAEAVLAEAPALARRLIDAAPDTERNDSSALRERVRAGLEHAFRKRTGRTPLVLPLIVEN